MFFFLCQSAAVLTWKALRRKLMTTAVADNLSLWVGGVGFQWIRAKKAAASGPYLSSSSGHVVVAGASRCDLNPLRHRGRNTDVKNGSRTIKLQIHNVTMIGFSVPDVLLLPAQRLTSVSASKAQVSMAHRPACYWLNQTVAGVGRVG